MKLPIADGRWPIVRGLARWTCVAAIFSGALFPQKMRAEEKLDGILKKAAAYLISQQEPTGGIHNRQRNETAMTSLAVLALASCGNQPGDPTPEGQAMRKALAFVLRPEAQTKDGYFGELDGSRMYGHGIVALMLSETTVAGHATGLTQNQGPGEAFARKRC